jgi:hypothetical protein
MNTKDPAKIAMRGAGYYSSNTVGAKAVIDKVGDLVVEAIGRMPAIMDAQPFSIADFGAAEWGDVDRSNAPDGRSDTRARPQSPNHDHLYRFAAQ